MTVLSQRDNRWKDIPLGFSTNTSIGSHGCTVTCLSMLAGVTPDIVNSRLKQVNGFANGNLVIWAKVPEALPNLEFVKRVYSYNNTEVSANLPCIVEVDYDGTPATNDRHWVVYKGNQKLNDPWTGTERPTSVYPLIHGYAIFKVKDVPIGDNVAVPKDTFENMRRKCDGYDYYCDRIGLDKEQSDGVKMYAVVENLTSQLEDCRHSSASQKNELEAKVSELTQKNTHLESQLQSCLPPYPSNINVSYGNDSDTVAVDNSGGQTNGQPDTSGGDFYLPIPQAVKKFWDVFIRWFRK
ncbi:MAG: hypothetical protein A2163_07780 [Actinobacteria bacterium RBG_13_35_12]|nr:MAG: hypothetical protein A2163_07780 [Actinobacteria bacterium RBG_13_35_12]